MVLAFASLSVAKAADLPAPSDRRSMKVTRFSNAERIRKLEWEGISLEMPWDKIAESLSKRGFDEATSARPSEFREFFKGIRTRVVAKPGESTYRVSLNRRIDGRVVIDFIRGLVPGGPAGATLEGTDTYAAARAIRRLACNGIVDPIERQRICPTDVDAAVQFHGFNRPVWLAGEIEVQVDATAQQIRIELTNLR